MLRCSILLLLFILISTVHGKKGGYLSPCQKSKNCAKPLVCRAEVRDEELKDLRCRPKLRAGQKCGNAIGCGDDLICSTARSEFGINQICQKPSAKNEICLQTEDCASGLVCRADNDQLVCLPKGKVGDACELHEDCKEKFICRRKHVTDKQYTCQKKATKSETCFDTTDCEGKLECRFTSKGIDAPMKCLPLSKKGEFCFHNSDCKSPYKCKGHRTQPRRYCSEIGMRIGDYCTESYYCGEAGGNFCRRIAPGAITTCQKYARKGDFCEENFECEKDLKCSIGPQGDGMCGRPLEMGQKCSINSSCREHHTCRAVGPSKGHAKLTYCLEPLANGKFCREDSDCKSEVCLKRSRDKTNLCRHPLPLGSVCGSSKHCASGLSCRKRKKDSFRLHCLPGLSSGVPCKTDDDCEENHTCRKNICQRHGS